MSSSKIPSPYYSVFDTSRDDDPAVVVVNSALRQFGDRQVFPWHLALTIECKLLAANGMPTAQEVGILERLEDEISEALETLERAVFLSRVTWRGARELAYRVCDPEAVNDRLSQLIATPAPLREWEYRIDHDATWELAQPVLDLLEQA